MPRFQFRFSIPETQHGERAVYESYVTTLRRLTELKSKPQKDVRIEEVQAGSGSVTGMCIVEAPAYEDALRLLCRETPILDLEWHVEEQVDPNRMAQILGESLGRQR